MATPSIRRPDLPAGLSYEKPVTTGAVAPALPAIARPALPEGLSYEPPAPAAAPTLQQPRSWGRAVGDLGVGLAEGAVSAGLAIPQLVNTLSGGAIDEAWKPLTGAVDRLAGGPGEGRTLAQSSQDTRAALDELKSPQLRAAEQDLANTKGFLPSAKAILTNPMLLGQQVAEQVPQFIVPAGAARKVGASVLEKVGAEALAKGTAKRVAAGLGEQEAAKLAMPAANRLAQRAASKAAGRAVMATGGAIGASQASEQAQQEVMGLDQSVMDANPEYLQLRAQGLSDADARQKLAITAGMKAAAIALPFDTLTSGLSARLEGNIFRGQTGVQGLSQLLSKRGAAGVAKAAGKEGAEETLQEGGEQFAQNVGVQGVDPNKSLMDQVPEQAALGGTIGAVLGAGGFAGSSALSRPSAHAAPPGSLTDAANVLSQPANGPIGRAAQEGVANGAVAAAAQAANPPAEAPSAQSTRVDPGVAPWADPTTGELANPSPADLIRALADHMVAQHQATGDMRINAQQIAEAWGVPKGAVERTRKAATTMASDQLAAAERAAMAPPAAAPAEPEPGTTASIPFMITQQMRADLRALGHTDAEIAGMTPEQANTLLQAGQSVATAPQETTDDERVPEPAPAAPAGTGAEAARAADEQPAAGGEPQQPAGSGAATQPAPDSATAVAGERAATDANPTLTPPSKEAPADAETPASAAPAPGLGGNPAAVAGEGGEPAAGAAETGAPAAAAEAPAEPKAKVTRAPKAPKGRAAAPANHVHAAIQRIAEGEHPEKVLAEADEATVRAVGAAMGKRFSTKAPLGAMVERIGETAASDRRRLAADALVKMGRQKAAEAPPLQPVPSPAPRSTQSVAARKAESLRVKTPTGEVNGRSHVDHLIKDGYTHLTSTRAGDKLVHSLAKADGTSEKIHARQLAYAQERLAVPAEQPAAAPAPATADKRQQIEKGFAENKAAIVKHKFKAGDAVTFTQNGKTITGTIAKGDKAGMVKDMGVFEVEHPGRGGKARTTIGARRLTRAEVAPTPAAPTTEKSSTVAPALDRAALRDTFAAAFKKHHPTQAIGREFLDKNADEVVDAIERKDGRALVSRNLGSAEAMPAARAVFEAATGIKLPKGRRASEDAIYRWAGSSYEAEQARKADARKAAADKKREPVEKFPEFTDYRAAESWVRRRAEAFGGVKKYAQTEEYRRLLPTLRELAEAHNNNVRSSQAEAMAAVGVKEGDTVESSRRGMQTKHGWVDRARGKVFMKDGAPWVRLEDGATVRHPGQTGNRRAVPWSKEWLPVGSREAPTEYQKQQARDANDVSDELEARAAALDAKIGALTDDQARAGLVAIGEDKPKDLRDPKETLRQQHPDDIEAALKAAVEAAKPPQTQPASEQAPAKDIPVPAASDSRAKNARTAESAVTDALRSVANEVEKLGTNNGQRALDARWAAGAIKRLSAANGVVKGLMAGKQTGALAVAKIGMAKAKTPDDVRRVADKLEMADKVEAAASEAASHPDNGKPEPTPAQKEAGNYEKGHVSVQGLDISIENPRGSTRSGVGENGKPWSHVMTDHYGYIRRTEGADGEQVDVYVGPNPASDHVYVVDQLDQKTGGFDEHKAMIGFDSETEAVKAYRGNFDQGWKVGPVHAMSMDEFKAWLKDGDTTRPASERETENVATPPPETPPPGGVSASKAAKPALKRAAGNKVVDEDGRPLTVYHGTEEPFTGPFDAARSKDAGIWFTPLKGASEMYGRHAIPAHVRLENPYEAKVGESRHDAIEKAQDGGHDGIIVRDDAGSISTLSVFDASAIQRLDEDVSKASEPAAAQPLDDFGQRLEGARKFMPPSLKEELGDDQIASQPLSKFWPADAYKSIEDPASAALAFAARAEVPAKPRVAYKVKRWVEQVKTLRSLLTTDMDERSQRVMMDMARRTGHRLHDFFAKVRLLAQLPRDTWGRVDRVGEHPDAQKLKTDDELKADGFIRVHDPKLGNDYFRMDPQTGEKTGPRIVPWGDTATVHDSLFKTTPFSSVTIDGKTHTFDGAGQIGPDEVQQVKSLLAGESPKQAAALTKADFEIRSYRSRPEAFINRKGDAEKRPLKTFTGKTTKEAVAAARAWLGDNVPALEKAWEAVKARDNVSKADTRRKENRAREGVDRRNGKDVTPAMFEQALGFRGVQFGNWVGQGKGARDRQGMLNEAYDALLDLADLLGIPSRAISLNGSLGLALGARGAGRNNAHFEPSNLVINLTKTKGAGSLAHEWFHALDNYFSRLRGGEVPFNGNQDDYRRNNFITYKPEPAWVHRGDMARAGTRTSADLRTTLQQRGMWKEGQTLEQNAEAAGWQRDPAHKQGVRPEVERAFADLVQALNDSPMAARVRRLDKSADGYWHRIIERGARSFENYVISKLALNGQSNDFLANVADWKAWAERGKNMDRYPYLKPEEEAPVVAAFDKLFDTVQTREDDAGNVALFSRDDDRQTETPAFRRWFGDSKVVDAEGKPLVVYHGTHADFTEFKAGPRSKYGHGQQIPGMYFSPFPGVAEAYGHSSAVHAGQWDGGGHVFGTTVVPVYLSIKNPRIFHNLEDFQSADRKSLEAEGFDGAMRYADDGDLVEIVAFHPEQIKSATGNNGNFDAANPDIRFRMEEGASTTPQTTHTARIEQLATAAMGAWKGDDVPRLRVVDTPEQLPPGSRFDVNGSPSNAYKSAAGMYDGRTIWIVASKHTTDREGIKKLLTTMAHEGVGHYGMDRIVDRELGAGAWTKIEDAADRLRQNPDKASPAIRAVLAELDKRYPDADRKTYAREFMAVTAERGVKNGLLDRVVSAIRRWLRRVLPDLRLSEHELRQLVVASDRYLRVGETQQQRVQSRAALAFSTTADPTRTPQFKQFFGDWERLAVQRRLDATKPVDITVPAAWRGEPIERLRAHVAEALDQMVHAQTVIAHPQLGDIHVGRKGAKKTVSTSRDPAKMLVAADLANALPKAVPSGFVASAEQGVKGYSKLLLPVRIDGAEMVAIFTVRHQADGQWYYNTVTVADKKMRPGSYESPGALARPLGETPITGLDAFVRRDLQRVNPDEVSKVVDAAGNPLVLYHGTAEDFSVFGHDRAGEATGHATSPLGHFFTPDRAQAAGYARNASEGRPADERVVDAYLAIRNPYTMTLKQAQAIETPAQARAIRAKLEAEGYDGIRLPQQNAWVAFHSEQIKSASGNRGTFDSSNPNIYFSRDDADPDNPNPTPRPFGDASASIETMQAELPQLDRSAYQKAKDWVVGKARDFEPAALGALQLRHVLELAADDPTLKAPAKAYADLYQRMDGDRNQMQQTGAEKVDALQKWARQPGAAGWLSGKVRPEAVALFKFMHAVTQLAVDPTNAYEKLLMRDSHNEYKPWTKDLIKERKKVLREAALSRSGDDKTRILDELKELDRLPQRERVRAERYPKLVAQWNALSPEAKHHFEVMRDHYQEQSTALEEATVQQLQSLDIPDQNKRTAIQMVRNNFRDAKVDGVYFPLTRFGDYWISLRKKDGEYVFAKYETANAMVQAEKQWLAAGATIEARGRQDNNYRAKDAPSGTFIGDLMGILKNAPDKTKDEIYQMYLKTLPALSLRKHGIHRSNIAGYSDDVPRAFAGSVFHGAHQISKARYGWRLQSTMEQMRERMEARRTTITAAQAAHGDALLGELARRHDWVMNPTNSQLASKLTSIGFSYYLAASPASALVNLIQVPQIVLPVLGAQHGWGRATRVLTATMRDAIRTGGHIDKVLTGEDLQAFKALAEQGTFQRSAAHALASISEGDQLRASPLYTRVMNAVSWMFHTSEVINREGTGMAAFRLARAKGMAFDAAVKYADEITNGTHGDYSNANRARYMQGNTMKVLTQFKNYSLAMSWLWGRQFHQAFKGESPEVRATARRTLTGLLGMTGLFAGVVGMPIFNLLRYGAMAAHAVTGDPDEPWDFMTEFRAWLSEHLGDTAADLIANGAASQLGANVASRVSMSDLWFRDADRQLEGEDAYNAMLQAIAGPLGGMIKNMYVGAQQFNEGHTQRGIETMLPTFAKNAVKSVRYASQGVNTLRGDPIVADISGPEALIQAIGFQPTRVAQQQRLNNSLYTYQAAIKERRQALMNGFAMAQQAGDVDGRMEALRRIRAFNAKNPEVAIGIANLRASLQGRARFSADASHGIRLDKKLAARLRQEVGASP